MDDQPSVLWKLRRGGDEVACQARLVPYGIEVDVVSGGAVALTRVFETDQEALAWARQKRTTRESQGWVDVPVDPPTDQPRPA